MSLSTARNVVGETFRKGKGQGTGGGHVCLCFSFWAFVRKEDKRGKEGGEEDGKEGRAMPLSTARDVVGATF